MKILITGSNGFIANNIKSYFIDHELTCISRKNFDLRNTDETNKFFKNKYFDVVIHCAISGGYRLVEDSKDIVYDNIKLAMNLMINSRSFGKLIHFGSGAELDRANNIFENKSNMFKVLPDDPYGFSKNIIARLLHEYHNTYNLRIFNVFAYNEGNQRMIKNNVLNYINKKPIVIHQDKFMDFMHMEDFLKIVENSINGKSLIKEIDCVYKQKYKLSDIAKIINKLSNHEVDIIVENSELGLSYCGYNYNSDIDFDGLELGIKKVYESLL
jgi:GDP-L-fucose synthase